MPGVPESDDHPRGRRVVPALSGLGVCGREDEPGGPPGPGAAADEAADVNQPDLFAELEPQVSEHRVDALANVLAGFRWPGRGSFVALKKGQQQAVLEVARGALAALAKEPD